MKLWFLALLAIVPSPSIVGGLPAGPDEFPFYVALIGEGSTPARGHFCGGSLIAPDLVLTAAHCAEAFQPEWVEVYYGPSPLPNERRDLAPVQSIQVHPSRDLALLHLGATLDRPTVKIGAPEVGEAVTIIGYGYQSEEQEGDGSLRKARIKVLPPILCSRYGKGFDREKMVCAGLVLGQRDTCFGDSGGPLLALRDDEWLVVGVTSFGMGCARPFYPGVYAIPLWPESTN